MDTEKIVKLSSTYLNDLKEKFDNLSSEYQEHLNESIENIEDAIEQLEGGKVEVGFLIQNIQKMEPIVKYFKQQAQNEAMQNGTMEEDASELQEIYDLIVDCKTEIEEVMDEDGDYINDDDDDVLNLTNRYQPDSSQRGRNFDEDFNKKNISAEFADMDISRPPETKVVDSQAMKPAVKAENFKFNESTFGENVNSEIEEIRKTAYDDFIERHKEILDKINNFNIEINPETLKSVEDKMEEVKICLENLNKLHTTTIEDMLKNVDDTIKTIITNAVEEGKITAELDKRSKTFITAGGVASFVFAILVIIMGIWGNKYVQEANKYENLMAVFDVMPKDQYDQIQTWVQTSYQNVNPGNTNIPVPAK